MVRLVSYSWDLHKIAPAVLHRLVVRLVLPAPLRLAGTILRKSSFRF